MKGIKGLALSMVVILLCITTVIGGTFALFTDTVTVKNHLESGVLDATLIRESATKVILGDDGYVKTENVGESDFTGANQDNVFGLELGDKIVPGSVLNANMKITNDGEVAFGYYVKFVLSDETGKVSDQNLAKQLKVTITGDVTVTGVIADGLNLGDENNLISSVAVGESKSFSVKVEFIDDSKVQGVENNDAMAQNVYIDFIIVAVQQLSK